MGIRAQGACLSCRFLRPHDAIPLMALYPALCGVIFLGEKHLHLPAKHLPSRVVDRQQPLSVPAVPAAPQQLHSQASTGLQLHPPLQIPSSRRHPCSYLFPGHPILNTQPSDTASRVSRAPEFLRICIGLTISTREQLPQARDDRGTYPLHLMRWKVTRRAILALEIEIGAPLPHVWCRGSPRMQSCTSPHDGAMETDVQASPSPLMVES